MEEDGGDVAIVLEPSETPEGTTGQGAVRQADDLDKADIIPAEENRKAREATKLARSKDPETTPVTRKSSRGRPKRFFSAAWRGIKSKLLCSCGRRD